MLHSIHYNISIAGSWEELFLKRFTWFPHFIGPAGSTSFVHIWFFFCPKRTIPHPGNASLVHFVWAVLVLQKSKISTVNRHQVMAKITWTLVKWAKKKYMNSYFQQSLSSWWVSDCCLTPIQQVFSYIMVGTGYFSMRWWWDPLCSRPTRWVEFV